METLQNILAKAAKDGASDVFFVPGGPISYKLDGGQVPAFVILHLTGAAKSMFRDSKKHLIFGAIAAGSAEGILSMDQSIQTLYRAGRITRETTLQYAENPELMRRFIEH